MISQISNYGQLLKTTALRSFTHYSADFPFCESRGKRICGSVVTAYSHEGKKIKSSYYPIPVYLEEVEKLEVEIEDSIKDLLANTDVILMQNGRNACRGLTYNQTGSLVLKPKADYKPLLNEIVRYFETGSVPVSTKGSLKQEL